MEIDTGSLTSNQSQSGTNKRQKLNTTGTKILTNPANGDASLTDDRAYVINTEFFDDPFGVSREEVSFNRTICEQFLELLF